MRHGARADPFNKGIKHRNSTAPAHTHTAWVRAQGVPLGVLVGQKLWGQAQGDAVRVQLRQVLCLLRTWAGATFTPAQGFSRATAAEGAVLLLHLGLHRLSAAWLGCLHQILPVGSCSDCQLPTARERHPGFLFVPFSVQAFTRDQSSGFYT